MSVRLDSIVWLQAHEYRLTFRADGGERVCVCKVISHHGLPLVQAEPNFLYGLGLSPRLVAAVLVALEQLNDDELTTEGELIGPHHDAPPAAAAEAFERWRERNPALAGRLAESEILVDTIRSADGRTLRRYRIRRMTLHPSSP